MIDTVTIALMKLKKVALLVQTILSLLIHLLKFVKNSALKDISEINTLKYVIRVVHILILVLHVAKLVLLNVLVLTRELV